MRSLALMIVHPSGVTISLIGRFAPRRVEDGTEFMLCPVAAPSSRQFAGNQVFRDVDT